MIRPSVLTICLVLIVIGVGFGQAEKPLLLQQPTLSRTHIVFAFAGDLWIVGRDGGQAQRLTTGAGLETRPHFSPDGQMIAFTGEYEGNVDVYIVPATGGVPRRLTYHPEADVVVGWTPDGKQVLFRSNRNSHSPRFSRLFTMPLEGGFPTELPLPMAEEGAYSPDGSRLAYLPIAREPFPGEGQFFQAWKRYRGGMTTPIWIAKLADSTIEKIPRENSNDFNPMWIGNRIYFLSDRNGPVTLFAYDTATKRVTQVIRNDGLDIKSASAGPGAIIYEQFGSLHLFDLSSGQTKRLNIQVAGDVLSVRPRFEKLTNRIVSAGLSPTGARAVFEARGEIVTVPAEKGNARNLTNTPGVAERDPAWSPDGKWIAYFSDESGEYQLHVRDQSGMGETRKINLGNPPSFFYSPTWSPDSKKIAYTDKRLNLWYVDLDKGTPVKVDTNTYENPWRMFDPAWSPDSRWIVYTKQLKNRLGTVFVYSVEEAKSYQITDGMSDARFASFDKSGKYIYFTTSTDVGPTTGWLDMSSFNRRVTRSAYIVVLRKDLPSPLAPESDEEKQPSEGQRSANAAASADKPAEKKEPDKVTIDLENISQRILALPIPARNYTGMIAGKAGTIYLLEAELGITALLGPTPVTLHKFELEKRKLDKMLEGISTFELSANGEKMLYRQGERWVIAATGQPVKPGEGALKLDEVEIRVDPRAEWNQMYREVWRIQRDFVYDPGWHGLDLRAAEQKYRPYVDGIAHRADLNYLFVEMLGELSLGHLFVAGGDLPPVPSVRGGLLGADYKIENGRYRFARVYNGENWNPQLRAPLTQPGVNVQAGEYLLAVNGRELRASDNIYSFFEGTADKQVVIRVGPDPGGANARDVTVVPVASEAGLRNMAWIEDNRRKVDQLSGGRLAYVYLPDTAVGGYTNFNRYYFSQIHKEGAIIDERFNGGGTAADYIIDYLRRPLMNYWTTREGEDFTTPVGSIFGPKAMIINEYAGSGGDLMPWMFRRAGIGPLIGKRTWGGLVGIYDYPPLIDGGQVTAPRVAFYSPDGQWDVENRGVAPDIEVEFDPAAWRAGRDPQLEKAVETVMEMLRKNPLPKPKKPAYPNYHTARKER
ncbi:MAG: PDZ domain-containing protein [Acidobacteriota bacterium]|nr:PDZ domain-containing protein [Blastocatellia bacterium]MDW8240891.1 PDZ domain-containing protein [Acidobacteriota bacterium]